MRSARQKKSQGTRLCFPRRSCCKNNCETPQRAKNNGGKDKSSETPIARRPQQREVFGSKRLCERSSKLSRSPAKNQRVVYHFGGYSSRGQLPQILRRFHSQASYVRRKFSPAEWFQQLASRRCVERFHERTWSGRRRVADLAYQPDFCRCRTFNAENSSSRCSFLHATPRTRRLNEEREAQTMDADSVPCILRFIQLSGPISSCKVVPNFRNWLC